MSLNPNAKPFVPVSRFVKQNTTNPQMMPDGIIRINLQAGSRLDIAPSRAIKVWNVNLSISAAISHDGRAVALSHPNCFLLHDGTTKFSAFDSAGLLGYAYRQEEFMIMSSFNTYCIWESGECDPLNRRLYPEEMLNVERDFVGALFTREHRAEASELPTSPVRHLTYHNSFSDHGIIERCHVYGYDIVQDLTGYVTVLTPQGDTTIALVPNHGLALVCTPTLLVEARSDQPAVLLHILTADLSLYNAKKKLYAKSRMFKAGINAHSFFCRELHRPITHMYNR